MAAPAAAIAAKAAAQAAATQALKRLQPRPQPPPAPKDGRGTLKALIAIAVTIVLLPALIVAVLIGGAQQNAGCAATVLPGAWTGPGSLGGVAGTGVTHAELATARRIPGLGGMRLTAGVYSPTAYFPSPHAPSTNCAATCVSTASGIRVNNATRRAYLIASNPQLNQYGALAYIWPNPYGWTGPFVVADTGSAFRASGRLDFYIFLGVGESWQQALARAYQWGPANHVHLSATPIRPGRPTPTTPPQRTAKTTPRRQHLQLVDWRTAGAARRVPLTDGVRATPKGYGPRARPIAAAVSTPAAAAAAAAGAVAGECGAPAAAGSLGELRGTPEQIVNRVVLYAHDHGFPNVTPASVRAANDAHSILTASNNVSDHKGPPDVAWAADIANGTTTPQEDTLARTLATAFHLTWPGAGLATGGTAEYRIQLIYRTCGGGDHFTHVHFGIKRQPGPRPTVLQTAYGRPGCA
jgi:3D (Asp-Asp-Asp) domain-containing protein